MRFWGVSCFVSYGGGKKLQKNFGKFRCMLVILVFIEFLPPYLFAFVFKYFLGGNYIVLCILDYFGIFPQHVEQLKARVLVWQAF